MQLTRSQSPGQGLNLCFSSESPEFRPLGHQRTPKRVIFRIKSIQVSLNPDSVVVNKRLHRNELSLKVLSAE